MSRSTFVAALRWLAVLPASMLTTVALMALTQMVTPRRMAQLPGTPIAPPTIVERYVLPTAFLTAMSLAFVIVGAKVAPRRRSLTAIGLAVLWGLYAFQLYILVHLGRGRPHWLLFVVAALAAMAGVAHVRRSDRADSWPREDSDPSAGPGSTG